MFSRHSFQSQEYHTSFHRPEKLCIFTCPHRKTHISYLKTYVFDSNMNSFYYLYMLPLSRPLLEVLGMYLNSIANITIGLKTTKSKYFTLISAVFGFNITY